MDFLNIEVNHLVQVRPAPLLPTLSRMACLFPVATELHESFLKPAKLIIPHPARHADEVAVAAKDFMRSRHTVIAS